MAKPTAAWGIDIGQCALKALKLELVDGVATATAFDYIEHAKILSQPDADADQLTREALEKFLSRNQLGNDLVAIGVPGQSGLARFVKLPPVEPAKIPDIVRFEAKQQIPFPLEDVVWDYQNISGGEVVDKFAMDTEIGLFAMKKEVIAKHMGQFNQANVEVHVVQMAPLALCNYATYEILGKGGPNPPEPAAEEDTPRGKKKCVVVLDVGTDATNLIITDAGKIIWQRPLPLGGNHFTRALVKEMKLTFPKAEHLKRNAAKSPDLAAILKALRPVLTDFVGEVQRSLGYFTNTHRDAHVAYLVGLGSAFRLPGLQKYMSEKLSLEVKRPSTVERLAGDSVKNDPTFTDNILTFPVAYGLALQGLNELGDRKDYGRINTNLLPGTIKVDRMIRAKKPYAAAAAAALLLGTGVAALGYGAQYSAVMDAELKKSIDDAKNAAKLANDQAGRKNAGEAEIVKIQGDVKSIIKGNDNRLDMIRMNEVLLDALPRPGQGGNLTEERVAYWNSEPGLRALEKYGERLRKGVTVDQVNDDDLSEFLATVQIESVYSQYTESLKGFLENADAWVMKTTGEDISSRMPAAEKAQRKVEDVAGQKKAVWSLPDGAGYVFQLSGYSAHQDGPKFLQDALQKNFININSFAKSTLQMKTFEELKDPKDPNSPKVTKAVDEVGYYLPGVKDPVGGRVSHAFLLLSPRIENPQPKVFVNIVQDYLTPLLPAVDPNAAGGVPMAGATPPPVDPASGAGGAAALATGDPNWKPFTGMPGMAPGAAMPPAIPPVPVDPNAKPAKKKYRYEFVLCFIWRTSDPAAGPAAPGAPGVPAAAPTPGK